MGPQRKRKRRLSKSDSLKNRSLKLNNLMDQFSVTLNKKHYSAAMQVREEAKRAGLEDIQLHVHAGDIYKKSFTFPQIANNDYAVEQFETLAIAESNLNNDPANEQMYDAFVKTADDVA